MSKHHVRSLPTHKRRSTTGKPLLTYQDQVTGVIFAWTTDRADPVELIHRGEVTNLTTTTPDGVQVADWMDRRGGPLVIRFKAFCDLWLAAIKAGKEPRMVREVI